MMKKAVLLVITTLALWGSCTPPHHDEVRRLTCYELLDRFDYEKLKQQAAEYLNEANRSGNKYDQAYAHFYTGVAALYTGNHKEAIGQLTLSRNMAGEMNNDTLMALALNSIGIHEAMVNANLYLAQWYFMESLKHAQKSKYVKLEGSIYGNMCSIAETQQDTSLINYVRKCYNLGLREHNAHIEFVGAQHLSEMFSLKGQYDSAQWYCRRALAISRQQGYKDEAMTYANMAEIYFHQGKWKEADAYANQAIRQAGKSVNLIVLANAYNVKANICHAQGNYSESNDWLVKELSNSESLGMVKAQIYQLMALNFKSMGNTEQALKYMTHAKNLADSANASDREHLKRERDLSFNVIEQARQIEFSQKQLRSRTVIITVLGISVALLAYILFISIRNLKRRNELYKNIVRQNRQALQKEKELHERIRMLSEDKRTAQKIAEDKSQQIFDKLCRLMEDEQLYTQPQLTRETLIERLGTNHTYFSKIIKEKANMNYAQFVNSYRINKAIAILSDKSQIGYPLKKLSSDLGFSSVSTFYKLFKEATGISPSAYRKSLEDLQ